MLLLSDLVGADVRAVDGSVVGRLVDLTIEVGEEHPSVRRLAIGRRRHVHALVDWDAVVSFEHDDIQLDLAGDAIASLGYAVELPERELRLVRDVLDTQIIDVAGKRLARVSEVLLTRIDATLRVAAVEVGAAGVWRRLGVHRLAEGRSEQAVDWRDLHLTSARGHALQLATEGSAVHRLGPADLASVVAHLPTPRAAEVLDAVSATVAASALSTTHPLVGARLLDALPPERASSLITTMPIDDAAAVLRGLPPDAIEAVLARVHSERGARLRRLVAHPADTAGGLMSDEVRTAAPGEPLEAIRARVAADRPELEGLATVFVVDAAGRPLGTLEPSDLLAGRLEPRAAPRVPSTMPVQNVVDLFALNDYHAVPVVDADGKLVGGIAVDDVLEELLAERLPGQGRYAGAQAAQAAVAGASPAVGRAGGLMGTRRRIVAFAAVVGPGLLAGLSDDDPAGITTYSVLGAKYGYELLWVLLLSTVALVLFHDLGARMGVVTGQGLTGLVREAYGVRHAALAVGALIVANIGTTCAEFAGIAAGFELFGVSRYASVPLAAAAVSLLVLRGSFHRVEHVLMLLSAVFITYVLAGLMAGPDWAEAVHGTVVPTLPRSRDAIAIATATIGTTLAPWGLSFIQSYAADKRLTANELRYERVDVVAGAVLTGIIGFFVVIACAATLHPAGVSINDASDAAQALDPLAGALAGKLFGIGLIGAALLAASIVPLSTAYSVSEFVGREHALDDRPREAPLFYGSYAVIVVISAVVILIPEAPLVTILVLTQIMNAVLLLPLLAFMYGIARNPTLMGEHVAGRGAAVGYLVTIALIAGCVASLALLSL